MSRENLAVVLVWVGTACILVAIGLLVNWKAALLMFGLQALFVGFVVFP